MSHRTTPRRIRRAAIVLALGAGVAGASVASAVQNPPTVIVPAVNAEYALGSSVASQFGCDESAVTCEGPAFVDTSTPGPKTFTATATDIDGPVSTDVAYTVVVVDLEPPTGGTLSAPGTTRTRDITVGMTAATDASPPIGYALVEGDGVPTAFQSSIPASFPLSAGDGSKTLRLWATDSLGFKAVQDSRVVILDQAPPPPPSLTTTFSSQTTNNRSPGFEWSGEPGGGDFRWSLSGPGGSVALGSGPATTYTPPTPLPDGSYTFTVAQRDAVDFGAPATRGFTLDATAPRPPTITSRPPASGADGSATFAWTSDAPADGSFAWQLRGPGGGVLAEAAAAQATRVTVVVGPGAYSFRVRQTDAAGNVGEFGAPEAFTVTEAPRAADPGPADDARPTARTPASRAVEPRVVAGQRPRIVNARRLTPRAAARFASVRPTLRWKRHRGAVLYNVQIFRVDRRGVTKVVSAFPRATRYRVPAGRLKAGRRYVWRVWPYMSRSRSTRAPLGVSFFDVRARARR